MTAKHSKDDTDALDTPAAPSRSVREAAEEIRNYVDGLICAPPMRDFERNEIERIISKYFCSPVSAAGGDEGNSKVEQTIDQWRSQLTQDSFVSDEDAEDLTLRLLAGK